MGGQRVGRSWVAGGKAARLVAILHAPALTRPIAVGGVIEMLI